MTEAIASHSVKHNDTAGDRFDAKLALRYAWILVSRRYRLPSAIVGGSLVLCFLYCMLAPKKYEAKAQVALRIGPETSLNLTGAEGSGAALGALGQAQLETIANAFRSDELALKVIASEKLAQSHSIPRPHSGTFGGFFEKNAALTAESPLLDSFARALHVRTLPRTLIVEIRFRSYDAALSAIVVNALIREYTQGEESLRIEATTRATDRLRRQLTELKSSAERKDRQLAEFQSKHGLLFAPENRSNGGPAAVQHTSQLLELDELTREMAEASAERIRKEALYHAAASDDPELVLSSEDRTLSENDSLSLATFKQIHLGRNELVQEQARLNEEHGPNFPRVVEIRNEIHQLDQQLDDEKKRLREKLLRAWQTAQDRERMIRKSLQEQTEEGQKLSQAATEYEAMRGEAESSRTLYTHVQENMTEANLSAGLGSASIWVVDKARPPDRPVTPNLPVSLAITLFCDSALLWIILSIHDRSRARIIIALLASITIARLGHAQAPTPSTSGLPTGVAHIPFEHDTQLPTDPKEAPFVWREATGKDPFEKPSAISRQAASMPVAIAPGDLLEISEFHTPEFHSTARVSLQGTIRLPLIDEVKVAGMSESGAAHSIAQTLVDKGMLTHPQVFVQVTTYAGMDVSVLGEVLRPGIYPLTIHHQLLDLISAASGLSPGAGALVTICHRSDPNHPITVLLDPRAVDSSSERNPEIQVGDTIQVGRAGVIYVVGGVLRPGGFVIDPTDNMTVLQAVSLAWGPSQNAALQKALLIREQKGGRTVTTLNLKRMLRGQDPDQTVQARDILFVPNSLAKNLMNRSMESVIQSAAGVSIYAGMVYSQRF